MMEYKPLLSLTQVKQAVTSHFFDKDTMRFFGSRVSETVYPTADGTYFVTSERDKPVYLSSGLSLGAWDGQRRYTVRYCAAKPQKVTRNGYTYTVQRGELVETSEDAFGRYSSWSGAHSAAKALQDANGGYPR